MMLPWGRPLPPALAGLLALLRLLPAVSRPLTLLLTAGVIAAAALPLGAAIVTGLLVGAIPAAVGEGFDSPAGRQALLLLAAVGGLLVAARLLAPLLAALAAAFGRRVDCHLQQRVMAAVGGPAGIAHLEEPETLDLIKAAQGVGAEGLRPGDAVAALASLLPSWLLALGSAAILATFRWWLGLVWLAAWPVILYLLQREFIRVGEAGFGQAAAMRRADYYRDLALKPPAAKEVRLWGLADWLVGRYADAWERALAPIRQARRPGRAAVWASAAAVFALDFGALGLLAWAALAGDLALGALAIYTRAALDASAFRAFDDQNMALAHAAVAVPSLLALERRLTAGPPRGGAALASDAPRDAIRLEGVGFRYPGQAADTLAGLDLAIPAGRSLAIVGANGAGKTTLVKLLCRLYEPTAGRVAIDGADLRAIDPAAWRRQVAAIFQDFVRYPLPARDNVALGAPTLADDMERLRRAAGRAGALAVIEALPNGWETILSREYAGGAELSGGQWQRLALARALLAVEAGARVLILDEPAANLDVRAEAELYDRFLELTAGLTTVLISHRFATVRRADRIVVLDGGRVVEDGTHDDLMRQAGRYARLFQLQAERFAEAAATDRVEWASGEDGSNA